VESRVLLRLRLIRRNLGCAWRVEQALPDYPLFRDLPGAGVARAPRLLSAFGEQRERYENAAKVQKYG